MPAHLTTYVIMVPVVALILWRRISRQFGRQPIRRRRMTVRIVIVAMVTAMLAMSGVIDPRLAEGLLAGMAGGALIGVVGLRLTRFEVDPDKGYCYVPNTWIGALLTALLLGRLAYRFLVEIPRMEQAVAHVGAQPQVYVYSPLTMVIVGLLMGYYLTYYVGLLVLYRRFQASHPDGHPRSVH